MDMENLEIFFTELYSNVHGTVSQDTKFLFPQEAKNINKASEHHSPLVAQF
jgi:hypothetical protein